MGFPHGTFAVLSYASPGFHGTSMELPLDLHGTSVVVLWDFQHNKHGRSGSMGLPAQAWS